MPLHDVHVSSRQTVAYVVPELTPLVGRRIPTVAARLRVPSGLSLAPPTNYERVFVFTAYLNEVNVVPSTLHT